MRIDSKMSQILIGAFSFLMCITAYSAAFTITREVTAQPKADAAVIKSFPSLKIYVDSPKANATTRPIVLPQDNSFLLRYKVTSNLTKSNLATELITNNAAVTLIKPYFKLDGTKNCSIGTKKNVCYMYVQVTPSVLFKTAAASVSVGLNLRDTRIKTNNGTATLVLTKVNLKSITVQANKLSYPRAQTTQVVKALASYNSSFSRPDISYSGTPVDISKSVLWTSSAPGVAAINASTGALSTTDTSTVGSTTITATLNPKNGTITTGTAVLTVKPATLVSINITPKAPSILVNGTQQFKAEGTYTDKTVVDITKKASWTLDKTGIATFNSAVAYEGQAIGQAAGSVNVKASLDSKEGTASLTVNNPSVTALTITADSSDPKNNSLMNKTNLIAGRTQAFIVTPTYDEATYKKPITGVKWSVTPGTGDAEVEPDSGTVKGKRKGTVTLTASYIQNGKTITAAFPITVTAPVLTSIRITPEKASIEQRKTQTYVLTGTYSDDSTSTLDSNVSWSSSNEGVVAIDSQGVATATYKGLDALENTVQIGATYTQPDDASVSFTATPVSLTVNQLKVTDLKINIKDAAVVSNAFQFKVGDTKDISVTASYSNADVAPVASNLLTFTSGSGAVSFNASKDKISGVRVTSSGAPDKVTVGISDVAYISGVADIIVTPATLTSVLISPDNNNSNPLFIYAGQNQKFIVTQGIYSDSDNPRTLDIQDKDNLTFAIAANTPNSTSSTDISIDSRTGTVSTTAKGTTGAFTVTALVNGSPKGSTVLQVKPVTLSKILIKAPDSTSIPAGNSITFTAQGVYSDSNTPKALEDIDKAGIIWSTSGVNGATIGGKTGILTSTAKTDSFDVIVTSTTAQNDKTAQLSFKVIDAIPKSLAIDQPGQIIQGAAPTQLSGTVTYTDGGTKNLSALSGVTWGSSNTNIATVTANGGAVTGVAAGTAQINAGYAAGNLTSPPVTVTVIAPTLKSITVSPSGTTNSPQSVFAGTSITFSATTGVYTNSPNTVPLKPADQSNISWTIAPTANGVSIDTNGRVTTNTASNASGTFTVTATLKGSNGSVFGTSILEIKPIALSSITITPSSSTVIEGMNVTLNINGQNNNGTAATTIPDLRVLSNDTSIATVATSGTTITVTAKKSGTTDIKASSGSISSSTLITVKKAEVTGITFNDNPASAYPGEKYTLSASATYNGIPSVTDPGVFWYLVSGPSTASLSSSGELTIQFTPKISQNQIVARACSRATFVCQNFTIPILTPVLNSMTIKPNPSPNLIIGGDPIQFVAYGEYRKANNQTVLNPQYDISALGVKWTSASGITINESSGVARGDKTGASSITATMGSISATIYLDVNKGDSNSVLDIPSVLNFPSNMKSRVILVRNSSGSTSSTISASSALPPGVEPVSSSLPMAMSDQTSCLNKTLNNNSTCAIELRVNDNFSNLNNNEITINNGSVSKTITLTRNDWEPNGTVYSTLFDESRNRVYLGGDFSAVTIKTGSIALLGASKGLLPNSKLPNIVGKVNTAVRDGNGGWYLGGKFTLSYLSFNFNNLVHISSTGVIDTAFNPTPNTFEYNKEIKALAYTGGALFVGGDFSKFNTSESAGLVRLDPTSGRVLASSYSTVIKGNNPYVYAFAFDNQTNPQVLFIGGSFDGKVAYINLSNKEAIKKFNTPIADRPGVSAATVYALAYGNNRLSIGGYFTGTSHQNFLSYYFDKGFLKNQDGDANDGALSSRYKFADTVSSIVAGEGKLYVGGYFASITDDSSGTYNISHLISFNTEYNSPDLKIDESFFNDWQKVNDNNINPGKILGGSVLCLALGDSRLYVGGAFSAVDGKVHKGIAAVKLNGEVDHTWRPYVDNNVNVITTELSSSNTEQVFIGGAFNQVGKMANGLAALDIYSSEPIDDFAVDQLEKGALIKTLALQNRVLIIGGKFTGASNASIKNLGAMNVVLGNTSSDGKLINWAPVIPATVNAVALTEAYGSPVAAGVINFNVFAGGTFELTDQKRLALFNKDGILVQTFKTSFDGDVNSLIYIDAQDKIIVGGNFLNSGVPSNTSPANGLSDLGLKGVLPNFEISQFNGSWITNGQTIDMPKVNSLGLSHDNLLYVLGSFNFKTAPGGWGSFNKLVILSPGTKRVEVQSPIISATQLNAVAIERNPARLNYSYIGGQTDTSPGYFAGYNKALQRQFPSPNWTTLAQPQKPVMSIGNWGNIVIIGGKWTNTQP